MSQKLSEEEKALLKLNASAGLRGEWLRRMISFYGGALGLLGRGPSVLEKDFGLQPGVAEGLFKRAADFDTGRELEEAEKLGVRLLFEKSGEYPALLRDISDPPPVLYISGRIPSAPCVALVGTRRPTSYGARTAFGLARDAAAAGAAVVSGLARGIDTFSHKGALEACGPTVAVLGTGLGRIYPRENTALASRIAASGGAVISEFPLETGGIPGNFPRRNRIISGMSYAVVVVEGSYSSGSMITAKCALEQGREVLAVPGQVGCPVSAGPNYLIKNGAAMAETAEDILMSLPAGTLPALKKKSPESKAPAPSVLSGLSPDAGQVYAELRDSDSGKGLTAEELAVKLSWQPGRTSAAIFELETSLLITLFGARYVMR